MAHSLPFVLLLYFLHHMVAWQDNRNLAQFLPFALRCATVTSQKAIAGSDPSVVVTLVMMLHPKAWRHLARALWVIAVLWVVAVVIVPL
jgi:hypothetical protein